MTLASIHLCLHARFTVMCLAFASKNMILNASVPIHPRTVLPDSQQMAAYMRMIYSTQTLDS